MNKYIFSLLFFCFCLLTPVWSEEISEAEYYRLTRLLHKYNLHEEPDTTVLRRVRTRYIQSVMSIYSQEHRYNINQSLSVIDDVNKILIIADKTLYDNIVSYVLRYAHDIHNYFGCQVDIFTVEGETYEDVKNLIVSQSTNLSGVVLIGDIIEANYFTCEVINAENKKEWYNEIFPCDLYYMDLNGTWIDDGTGILTSHTGDVKPEIFVGRINTNGMGGNELDEIKLFFDRDHDYWIGRNVLNKRYALTFTEEDWNYGTFWYAVSPLYGSDNFDIIKAHQFTEANYLSCLNNSKYEFLQIACHSAPDFHQFILNGNSSLVQESTIYNAPKQQIGYNLFCCSACKWTYSSSQRCLGESYLFGEQTKALAVVGSTKTGSMLQFDKFYTPLGAGICIGQSLKNWWINFMGDYHTDYQIRWHYGMSILGDPLTGFHYSNQCEDELILNSGEETTNKMYYAQSKIIVKNYSVLQGRQITLNAPTIEIVGPFECNGSSVFTTNTNEYCLCNDTANGMNRIQQKSNADDIDNCETVITNKIYCYPNPASDYIFVESLDSIEYILVYNVNGELITKTIDQSICLSHLPNGIYVLHVVTKKDVLKTKFIHS